MSSKRLYVSGLSKGTKEADLYIYFQSRKKSGGGDIESITFEGDSGAVITFEEEKVLNSVLSQNKHVFKGSQLKVSGQPFASHTHLPDGVRPETPRQDMGCKIKVRGLSSKTTKDAVENYFENTRRSGGGDVEAVSVSGTTAYITFADSEVVKNVISRRHILDGEKLIVELIKMEEDPKVDEKGLCSTEESASRVIEVSGLASHTTEDALFNYFENKRRSGGGEVENVEIQPGVGKAHVTFVLPEDAQCVVEKGSHRLDGSDLTVTLQEPVKQLPIDSLKLLVKGLNKNTTKDTLSNYMESITKEEVCEVIFGDDNNALVCFAEGSEPDFNRTTEKVKTKMLNGNQLTVHQVEMCNCVNVTGFPDNTTEDTIWYYFENTKRSGGGDVYKVDFNYEKKSALVHFEDPSVVESVVSRDHFISSIQVAVRRNYPFLGVTSEKESKALDWSHEVEYNQTVLKFVEDQCSDVFEMLLQENKMIVEKVPDEEKIVLKLEKDNEMNESDWERACNDVFLFLLKFGSKSVHVADEALSTFKERAQEAMTPFTKKDLEMMPISPENQVKLIGHKEKIEKLAQELEDLITDILEYERFKASVVTNELKDIPLPKLLLLRHCGLVEQLQGELQGLEIDVSLASQVIFFKGPKDMMNKAHLEILQMLAKSKEEILELPRLIVSVLETKEAQEYIYDSLEQQQLSAALFFENGKANEFIVAGINGTQARKAADVVTKLTTERSMHLKEEQAQLLETAKWRTFIRNLEKNNLAKVSFDSTTGTLWFGGCRKNVDASYNDVKEFLEKNTIVTESICIPTGQRKFLFRHLKEKVEAVQTSLKSQSVVIKDTKYEESAVAISGTEDGVNVGLTRLTKIIENVLHRNVPIDKPGMRKYFLGDQGAAALKLVENEHKCIVQIQSAYLKEKPPRSSVKHESVPASSEMELCSYVTPENKTISLYKGDITKHQVDVIVNAANSYLHHIGGVAKAIVNAGGREIQDDCRKHIDRQGELLVGDVFVSRAYKLPCKRIIHAVGPRWNYASGRGSAPGKKTKEERYLSLAIYNSLEEARQFSSIAFPAISTGVFGFPLELCAKTMLETILEYSEMNPSCSLKDIHIIDQNESTVKTFVSEMRERFGKEAGFRESAMEKESKAFLKSKRKAMDTSGSGAIAFFPAASSDPYTIVTPQNVSITLCIGDLAQQKVDALVNTTKSDMNLQANPCAMALSAAAGSTLQQECTSKAPLNTGELCVTSGGNLKSKIFHVNCGDEQSLCGLLQKCFKEANKRKLRSIAIPAIGTGKMGFPRDRVATISVDEAQSFIQKTSPTSLQEIRLVVFGKDTPTVQAFQAEFRRRHQSTAPQVDKKKGKRRRSHKISSASPLDEDDVESEEETVSGVNPLAVAKTGRRLEDSQFELKVGILTVQVQKGDITSEMVDAIATVSNSDLNIAQGGGVGAAILRAAGNSIQKECQRLGVQKPGSVVATGAGQLNAKSVYHIVPTSTDHDGIKRSVLQCLRTADSGGVSSISLPAIGTGNLGLSPKNSAKAILSAINKFSQEQIVSITLIRVVVFQASMLQDFQDALEEFVKDSPSSGFLSSVSGFVKGVLGYSSGETVKRSLSIRDKVSLDVFAGNVKDLENAIKSINDTLTKNCMRKVIDNEAIEKLSDKRKKAIMKLEEKRDVKISIETRAARIVVQGQASDLLDVSTEIYEILTQGVTEEHARDKAELLSHRVQWYYAEDGDMHAYDQNINGEIEQAFLDKKPLVHFTMDGEHYKITFKDNHETHIKTKDVTEVCRKDLGKGEIELPEEWEPQPSDATGTEKDVHLVPLDPIKNAIEYSKVSNAALQTASMNIRKIERVQNPALYKSYVVRKQAMDKKTGSNEKQLFHGTAGSSVAQINRTGFNRSYCGKNAVAFGKGVYFARDASYSARSTYSPADTQGYRYMYFAKVLVGQYAVGNSNMITPPSRSSSDPTDMYDSTADSTGPGASVFVVFYDNQCYPEYLITFK